MSEQKKEQKKFYLTTPIYYVNARPHIGHAYTTIAADVIARRHRLLGDDTFFLTGTDEHGQKIERSAAAAGIPPQQFADQVSASFENLWRRMGITYDDYIRTTDPRHIRGAQKLWNAIAKNGKIELSSYTGQYSIGEEMFVEGPPGTIGPDGKPTETVTEENYFFRLSDYQLPLINLIESNELSIQPEVRRNEVLSFLRGNISDKEKSVTSDQEKSVILSEARSAESKDLLFSATGTPYVPGALKDLSISRSSFKWGIPVPGDEKHVIYVWLDALANYMTAIGYGSEDPADIAKFEKYWPADLHLVGKEIIRFHCVYWPAFLMAAGLPLPKAITAHGWLLFQDSNNEASKMSKSKGNIVRTETILDAFGTLCPPSQTLSSFAEGGGPASVLEAPSKTQQDLFAADILRYFLLREIPFGQDGSFSFDALVQRYNSDLANGYGNLVSRTLKMIQQYVTSWNSWADAAEIPPYEGEQFTLPISRELKESIAASADAYGRSMNALDFSKAIEQMSAAIAATDGYISAEAPWKLAKIDTIDAKVRLTQVLHTAVQAIRIITALLHPILPHATAAVWQQLGLGDIEAAATSGQLKDLQWGGLKPGTKLGPLGPIFPRAPKELIDIMNHNELTSLTHVTTQADARTATATEFAEAHITSETTPHQPTPPTTPEAPATTAPEATPQIGIEDFAKIDLRVAKIVVAERIPKADKLLRLEVDLGTERRQILSGIAQWYTPEELLGKKIVIIANLAPRKMRGLESHGMLLAASHGEDGKPHLATFPETEEVPLGSRLK